MEKREACVGKEKSRCAVVYDKAQAVESLNGENRLMQIKRSRRMKVLRVDRHQRLELLPYGLRAASNWLQFDHVSMAEACTEIGCSIYSKLHLSPTSYEFDLFD